MNIEEFREYCMSMDGVTEKTPFGKFARRYESILVFYVLDHMFCFADMDHFYSVTLKAEPGKIEALRASRTSVSDPLNSSLRHWIQLDLGGDVSDSEVLARGQSLRHRKSQVQRRQTEEKVGRTPPRTAIYTILIMRHRRSRGSVAFFSYLCKLKKTLTEGKRYEA